MVIAVTDLDSAAVLFRDSLGFSLKRGRTHRNGLRNLHIRFKDGSALELITTGKGAPDALSDEYARFLAAGPGGAFVALRAGPPDSVLAKLGALASNAVIFEGRAFDWVSFPENHPLHPLFFVHVRQRPPDEPYHLVHENGSLGLAEVWLEMSDPLLLADALRGFGSTRCGETAGPGVEGGTRHRLEGGILVAVPIAPTRERARIVAAVLHGRKALPAVRVAGIRVRWRQGS